MNSYLVYSVQSSLQTQLLASSAESVGYITHCKWIICDEEHKGCAIIEAENEFEALLSIPPLVRRNAKASLLRNIVP